MILVKEQDFRGGTEGIKVFNAPRVGQKNYCHENKKVFAFSRADF